MRCKGKKTKAAFQCVSISCGLLDILCGTFSHRMTNEFKIPMVISLYGKSCLEPTHDTDIKFNSTEMEMCIFSFDCHCKMEIIPFDTHTKTYVELTTMQTECKLYFMPHYIHHLDALKLNDFNSWNCFSFSQMNYSTAAVVQFPSKLERLVSRFFFVLFLLCECVGIKHKPLNTFGL